jgi:alanine or glycine:cation symporter, AGCS family
MESLNQAILFLDGFLGSAAYFPWLLLSVGLFFTVYLGFPQLKLFTHSLAVISGKHSRTGEPGDISHFQALSTALSGTIGTGNIGGVALAIHLGGPAALFWMWATAFLGMATKFVEVTLSHKYRIETEDGTMAGGPMYYMDRRLNLKWLAVFFAVATVVSCFGTGSMPQINNIAQSLHATFGIAHIVTGAVLSVALALVIIGGIKRIAHVAQVLVPGMAVIYLIGAVGVVIANAENILPSAASIFEHAFTGSSAVGGFLGASFAYAFNRGVNRGLYSNEAGQGSAPIAHASAKADDPVSEGAVSIMEPFIDTIVVCTITGLAILASGVWSEKHQNEFQSTEMHYVAGVYTDEDSAHRQQLGSYLNRVDDHAVTAFTGDIQVVEGRSATSGYTLIHARSIAEDIEYSYAEQPYTGVLSIADGKIVREGAASDVEVHGLSLIHSAALTTKAFTKSIFGPFGEYIVSIGLTLFAFSTAIAWCYYGDRAIIFLFGTKGVTPFRIVYVIGFFVASFMDTSLVWNLAAVALVLMTLPNLVGIMLLHKEMKSEVKRYVATLKR